MGAPTFIAIVAAAYLVGSIPVTYVAARLVAGVDLREYGSGNLGGANIGSLLGTRWVVPTGGFDFLVKGVGLVALTHYALDAGLGLQVAAALAAVAGHNWSAYLGLTGGRGIAVALGSLAALSLPLLAVLAGAIAASRFVFHATGLGTLAGLVALPLVAHATRQPPELVLYCYMLLALTLAKRALANRPRDLLTPEGLHLLRERLLHDRDG